MVPESWIDCLGGLRVAEVSSMETTLEGVLDSLYYLRLNLDEVKRTPCKSSAV